MQCGQGGRPRISSLHYLGALVLTAFCLEVVTGTLLMVYYRPAAGAAYYSTGIIMDEVRFGWLVRSLHQRGADLLVLLLLLFMARVYFARAYQRPRHLNWASGVVLLVLVLALGFTGTLLPWDQYAYWYTESARQTVAGIPVLEQRLLGLFWGGWDLGEEVLLRFYAFHVGVLPWLAATCLGVHFLLVWRVRSAQPAAASAALWSPDFLLSLLIAALLLGGLLVSAAVCLPASLAVQADPLSGLPHVQPPWYLLAVRGLLQRLPGWLAALSTLAFFSLLLLLPVLDRATALPVWKRVLHGAAGLAVISLWVFLSLVAYLR
ncbi:MAG: cytochrome b N-terminal domain-containing protein [Candidatus Binatia bacterium]